MLAKSSTGQNFPWLKANFSSQSVQRYCLLNTLPCSVAVGNTFETEKEVACDKWQPIDDDGLPSYEAVVYQHCPECPPDVTGTVWPPLRSAGNSDKTTPLISKRNVKRPAKIPRIDAEENTADLKLIASDTNFPPSYESVICQPSLYPKTTRRVSPLRPLPLRCGRTYFKSKRSVQLLPTIPEDGSVNEVVEFHL